ncbi:VC0807 family protein [Spirillospora sp. CA-128828]|uniref:VC0807 family protein n=1 Tax=Spirillospora sp. CA-128828 TaxID=3240033 RepID=UPI003D909F9D
MSPVPLRTVLPSLALNGAVPLVVYLLLRPHLPGDAAALAVAMAVPAACTLAVFAWRRRVDAIGVIAVAAFGIALIVVLLSGGNAFVLKLQEAVVTGPVGLLFLGSAAVRRPILLTAARLMRRSGERQNAQVEARSRQASTVLTTIMGATFLVHAVALTVLALVLTTAEVLAVSRLVGLAIIGSGLMVVLGFRSRMQKAMG